MAPLTTTEVLSRIRFDPLTKKGSVLDVIQLVTDVTPKHAHTTWTALKLEFPEVSTSVGYLKFPGRGQRLTPVAPVAVLIEIAWLCPGRAAKEFRRQGAVTLCRALGGDLSLVEEIKARHADIDEDEQAALLEGTGVTVAEANGLAVIPVEHQIERYDAETARIKAETEQLRISTYEKLQAWAREASEARERLLLHDAARNLIQTSFLSLEGPAERSENAQITISTVATQMGVRVSRDSLKKAGMLASRMYRERHGEAPPKHEQFCDGRVILANTYTEADRDLVEAAILGAVQ